MGKERGRGRKNFRSHSKPYEKKNWRDQKKNHSHQNNGKPFNRTIPQPETTLREDQVFITEFTSPLVPGFNGVLKSRFSDFHVNEIDINGAVLELTDLSVPNVTSEPALIDPLEVEKYKLEFESIISSTYWQEMSELAAADYKTVSDKKVEIDVDNVEKETRSKIHGLIKQIYNGKLVSTTQNGEKKILRVMKPKPGRADNRWTSDPARQYVTFLVHKMNMDTSEVAVTLANNLNLRPSQVNYCGTKDKRAKTTQNFCIKRRSPENIFKASRMMRNVHIGNFKFQSNTLKLGDLQGNQFRIALRHINADRLDVENALESLRKCGFINYYGLQRFGNSACVPTYDVGIALLKRDYKLACELILKPRDNDVEFMRKVRETWWEKRDSAAAAAMIHSDKFIEKKLLDGLAKYGEQDYAAALRCIPRNMLLMYTHAYQSLIFNQIASRRIKDFGLNVIVGDLVYTNDNGETSQSTEPQEKNDDAIQNSEDNENEDLSAVEEDSVFKRKVRPLSTDDVASGNYKLTDIVLPLPGYDITYPNNVCGKWYEEILQENGLTSELLRHKEKTYALGGAYRKMIIEPTDLEWEFRSYKTPEDTLIASDWEKVKKIPITAEPKEETDSKYTALLLKFSLPTAAYATMFLRELLKQDTSTASQIQLEKDSLNKTTEKIEEKITEEIGNSQSESIKIISEG